MRQTEAAKGSGPVVVVLLHKVEEDIGTRSWGHIKVRVTVHDRNLKALG